MTFTYEECLKLQKLIKKHKLLKSLCEDCPIKECERCKILDEVINIESEIRKLIIKEESWELK